MGVDETRLHRAEFVCSVEHPISRTPPCVAMERDLQWRQNAAFILDLLKVLDALTRCLDLWFSGFSIEMGRNNRTNLYRESANDCNYI